MRTPITGVQARLDLLAAEPTAPAVESRVQSLQEGVRRSARAANRLLTLARADPTAGKVKNQTSRFRGPGERSRREIHRLALQADIDLGSRSDPSPIVADPSLLDDLLSNLVDNALE